MSFMDSLASNPSGSSGIYGQPSQQNDQGDILGIVNQLKDREMRDFQNKANFMSDLSLKQDRLRQLFNPETASGIPGSNAQEQKPQQMNTVMGHDPNMMTGYQKGELGVRQQEAGIRQGELGVRQQQVAQTGKMGEERLGIQRDQEKLNVQKERDIHDSAAAKLEARINEASGKLTQAQAALEAKTASGDAALAEHRLVREAMEERHKAETARDQAKLDQRDREFAALQKQHDELIKKGEKEHKVQKDAQGNEITTDIRRGSAADTVQVKHKNGKTYEIPKDKLDEWNASHAPEGEEP